MSSLNLLTFTFIEGSAKMKRLYQGNIADLTQRFEIPSNLKIAGIYFSFIGVNQAAQTLTLAELGQVQILKNNQQVDLWDFDKMAYLNNLQGGSYPNVSGAGAAFHLGCLRKAFLFDDEKDNCIYSNPSQKWEVIHTFPNATATIVASGTVRYFAVLSDDAEIQHNLLRMLNHDFSLSGAGTFSFPVKSDNVRALMIENDSALTSFSINKDGKPICENIERADLYGITQLMHKIETFSTTTPYILIDLNPGGEEVGSLSDQVDVTLTVSGSTVVKCLVISQDLTPNAVSYSARVRNVALQRKANQKSIKGLTNVTAGIKANIV